MTAQISHTGGCGCAVDGDDSAVCQNVSIDDTNACDSRADIPTSGRAPFLTALQDAIWSARRFATAASTAWVDARLPTVIRAAPSG
jgi:hypothetical protein